MRLTLVSLQACRRPEAQPWFRHPEVVRWLGRTLRNDGWRPARGAIHRPTSLAVGENGVELALGLVEHLERLVALLGRTVEAHLPQRAHDADRRVAEVLH